ncbi:hypothetical protein ACIQ7D_36315 [Streptomyces sp. NPDC096310]|uniref:hypothetical protein n=1 Tax=Streptomyces sp. NPDC096310 TaxID=3366082 RepID=UPI00382BD849
MPHRGLLDPALEMIKDCLDVRWVEDDRDTPGDEDRLRYPRLHVQAVMVGGEEDPDGNPYDCEIQLRTEAVDLWSRMSHKLLYKPGVTPPPDVRRSLYRLIALVELFDLEVERGVEAMAQHPDLARSNHHLLNTAEQIYRTFTDHPYSTDLSHEVIDTSRRPSTTPPPTASNSPSSPNASASVSNVPTPSTDPPAPFSSSAAATCWPASQKA